MQNFLFHNKPIKMNLEMSRLYKDIIEEVLGKLETEGESCNISRKIIFDLQNGWSQKIRDNIESTRVSESLYREFGSFREAKLKKVEAPKVEIPKESEGEAANSDSEDYELLEKEITNHFICLYVKVHRTRTKYKCTFKQGFVNIGNEDFAFSNAQGELDW